ncbi:MAG: DUF4230 domain-containing protein [Treponema sp.]|jgi:hypothetical protein|nr:DUF4230 domain-containing protein [Treponema sp.]
MQKGSSLGITLAITGLVLFAAGLLVVIGVLFGKTPFGISSKQEESARTMVKEVLPVSEYVSLVYRYTRVAESENRLAVRGWNIPLTTKKYLVVYDGTLKLGIDGRDIRVDQTGDTVQITLPPVKILSHQIHEETTKVYDQTFNIFNQLRLQDYIDFTAGQKAIAEEQAREDGAVFDMARTSLEDQFSALFRGLQALENCRIVFVWPGVSAAPPGEDGP